MAKVKSKRYPYISSKFLMDSHLIPVLNNDHKVVGVTSLAEIKDYLDESNKKN